MQRGLKIGLSESEAQKLSALRSDLNVPERTRKRAEVLCLTALGVKVEKISSWVKLSPNTVRTIITRWLLEGEDSLWDMPRSGRKRTWTEADIQYLEDLRRSDPKNYSSQKLSAILKAERNVELSAQRIRKILKKRSQNGSQEKLDDDISQTPSDDQ